MSDKMTVAQGVANHLFATEKAIDAALAEASQLMGSMVSARTDLRIAAASGDVAISKVADAMATLAAARRAVVEAHADLDQVKLRIGVRTRMFGEFGDKPEAQPDTTAQRHSA